MDGEYVIAVLLFTGISQKPMNTGFSSLDSTDRRGLRIVPSKEGEMDSSQIVTLLSNIALPILTGGLVWATIALWRSTSRYADATKEMAQSTEEYTRISEKLLKMERLNLLDSSWKRFFHTRIEGVASTTARYTPMGITEEDSAEVRKEKETKFCLRLIEDYGRLVKETLEDIEKEFL